jgi:hypothetical protein
VSTYPAIAAGQRITAALLTSMLPDVKVKAANESLSSNTTLQSDDELFLSVETNATYRVRLVLFAQTAASDIAGDIKVAFTFPAGSTLHFTGTGPNNADLALGGSTNSNGEWIARMSATSGSTNIPYGMSGSAIGIILQATLITVSTAGTLQLQWAQNTSDADALTVLAGSSIEAKRVA